LEQVEFPAAGSMLGVVVAERLHQARNVWLATVRSDGRPHVAPVWFVYVEDRFWIGTGLTSVRVRNLCSNPLASVCLEQGDEPVVAEGTVLIHEAARPSTVVEAFRTKYDWDITIETDNDIGQVTLLEFRPHRWLFGLTLPTVNDDR
jgi:F420H(2)-dependent biliverdin reductase